MAKVLILFLSIAAACQESESGTKRGSMSFASPNPGNETDEVLKVEHSDEVQKSALTLSANPKSCASKVDPFRSLHFKIKQEQVNSKLRDDGELAFSRILESITPSSMTALEFMNGWLYEMANQSKVGNKAVERISNISAALQPNWPKLPLKKGQRVGDLDLAKAPIQLVAVSNRLDIALRSQGVFSPEIRLVYAALPHLTEPVWFIFEFELDQDAKTIDQAAREWVSLSEVSDSRIAVRKVRELVVKYAGPGKGIRGPQKSSLKQVRISWHSGYGVNPSAPFFRQYEIDQITGRFRTALLTNSPDFSFNGSSAGSAQLYSWIVNNQESIRTNLAVIPAAFLGGQGNSLKLASGMVWDPANAKGLKLSALDRGLGEAFDRLTCGGCHRSGGLASGSHLDVAGNISPFLNADLKIRAELLLRQSCELLPEESHECPKPLRNDFNRYDTNADGVVSPSDVQVITSYLNNVGKVSSSWTCPTNLYLDVNGDGEVSAVDALLVTNYLNNR